MFVSIKTPGALQSLGILGVRAAADMEAFATAFRHKSAATAEKRSYERFEWVGDSVLGLVCSRWLLETFPDANEGDLTKMRTRVVGGAMLARVAERLQLHRHIETSESGREKGWHLSPRINEDVYEALIGCLYTQQGLVAAREFIYASLGPSLDAETLLTDRNFKDRLSRVSQMAKTDAPDYTATPCCEGGFHVSVRACGVSAAGTAPTKKAAEQLAAQRALESLRR